MEISKEESRKPDNYGNMESNLKNWKPWKRRYESMEA